MNVLDWIERMFEQYGYFVLLFGLPVDFIALPLPPGQTTLTYTGYLSYERIISLPWALLAAYAGSFIGITATYFIGYRVGAPLAERYGKWILLKPVYLQRTRKVYEKYGNKMLLISFFIPGVRQFFGYFVGMIRVPFRIFALYASVGAGLWVSLFVGIGYIFGEQWQVAIHWVEKYIIYFFIGAGGIASALIYVKWRKWRLKVAKLSR
ncbi:DedA family protein [Paenibacillus sanguinis]|uniref:DedA family protein n=1 Tax=Paenibacillus sanguinis TaxID=225906 RepID=UPI0003677B08|nr:DedA family protein [Paenibacillus sanguinis]